MKRVLLQLMMLILAIGCQKAEKSGGTAKGAGPVPVNLGEAVKKEVPLTLRAIGNVESIATVEIKAQVAGELIEVGFQEGQEVKKSDLLFSIQPKLYATQLAQADANLAKDRAIAANAEREVKRNTELAGKGAISKENIDQLRATAEAAAATVLADEALREIARVRMGFATIRSPIDGRTGALAVQRGNIIKEHSDTPMTTIKQIAPIYVTFSVPESNLPAIRRGYAKRKLEVTALDPQDGHQLGVGQLTFMANSVDMSTGTITLKGTFSNEDRTLWPGAYVDVVLQLDIESDVTVIPASAVTIGQRGPQVFVAKEDNSVELRTVTTGRTVGQETIIKTGVEPGERVVTNGQLRLFPGAKVLPKPIGLGKASETPSASGTAEPKKP